VEAIRKKKLPLLTLRRRVMLSGWRLGSTERLLARFLRMLGVDTRVSVPGGGQQERGCPFLFYAARRSFREEVLPRCCATTMGGEEI